MGGWGAVVGLVLIALGAKGLHTFLGEESKRRQNPEIAHAIGSPDAFRSDLAFSVGFLVVGLVLLLAAL